MTCSYDPQALGARCDVCPLREARKGGPVPPKFNGSSIVGVGQEPGEDEVQLLEPMVGRSGQEWDRGLESIGWRRDQIDKNNVLACRPPLDLDMFLKALEKANRKLAKEGKPAVPSPIDCCAPRLYAETAGHTMVLPLGAVAARVMVPSMRGTFSNQRGKMIEIAPGLPPTSMNTSMVPGRKILPTFNPAYVLRNKAMRKVFRNDLGRAKRWWEGVLTWQGPSIEIAPTPSRLAHFLRNEFYRWRGGKVHGFDTETTYAEPWRNDLNSMQFANETTALVVPVQGRYDPTRRWYSDAELEFIWDEVAVWASDKTIMKLAHNGFTFDQFVMGQMRYLGKRLGFLPIKNMLDTIELKHVVQPDTEHNLDYVGSFYTDIHDWKGDYRRGEYTDMEEDQAEPADAREHRLHHYGGIDANILTRVLEPMYVEAEERQQIAVLRSDQRVAKICAGMTANGMLIDQKKREEFQIDYVSKARKWGYRCRALLEATGVDPDDFAKKLSKKKLEEMVKDRDLTHKSLSEAEVEEGWEEADARLLGDDFLLWNPGSPVQLRHILFDLWNLPPPTDLRPKELLTKSGDLSTSDVVMRAFLQHGSLTENQRKYIRAVREYKKVTKLLGTYIHPLRMPTGKADLDYKCMVYADGRVHPRWLNYVPVSGRVASRQINAQNIVKKLRAMFIPAPGHVLVAADEDQIELRIAACLWHIELYLNAFGKIPDLHQITMAVIWGEGDINRGIPLIMALPGAPSVFGAKDFLDDDSPEAEFARFRKLDKTIQFGGQYGARKYVLHRIVTSAEAADGTFLFGHLSVDDVDLLRDSWLAGAPEYEQGWEKEKTEALNQGYLLDPIGGRRRDFVDGGDNLSEIANHKVQAGAASLLNKIMAEVDDEIPIGKWGAYTGMINQCHDQITLEVPEEKEKYTLGFMKEVMGHREVPGFVLPFTSKPKSGYNWAKV